MSTIIRARWNTYRLLVRSTAIEIANALLEQGYEEGMAIRIAIAKA